MAYLIKCVLNAYKNSVVPTYSSSNVKELIRSYGGTMFHHQVKMISLFDRIQNRWIW